MACLLSSHSSGKIDLSTLSYVAVAAAGANNIIGLDINIAQIYSRTRVTLCAAEA